MKEKAHIFFILLNESYRIGSEEVLTAITVASVPHMNKTNASNVISTYQRASSDIIDMVKDDNDYSNLDQLKQSLQ